MTDAYDGRVDNPTYGTHHTQENPMSAPTITHDANSILMSGGGAPTLKLDQQGVEVGGRIVAEPRAYQEREYDSRNPGNGAPKFYTKSGDPIMAVSVDIQTAGYAGSHSTGEEDDGVRRLYIQGQRLKAAIAGAVRDAGRSGLEIGGQLYVAFIGLGTPAAAGVKAPKLYQARYTPPTAGAAAANAALMNTTPTATAPTTAPAAQAVPAARPATPTPSGPAPDDIATARQLIAANLDDATILKAAPTLNHTMLAALRNTTPA